VQECNIVNNGQYAFYVSACHDPTTVIDATDNWWGIADSASIEALVYHNADNPNCPVVDYVPFADSSFSFDDTISCCNGDGIRANVDNQAGPGGEVDVADLTYLVAFLFQGGPAPPCTDEGNVDGLTGPAGDIDVADLTYLVAFLFQGGPQPLPCP
jgi:hypothetical protein